MTLALPLLRPGRPGFAGLLLAGWLLGLSASAQPVPGAPAQPLDFGQFFQRPVGPRGLVFSDLLLAAQGQQVLLRGHMVAQERPLPGRFLFTAMPIRLSEHADGEADDLPPATVTVLLDPEHRLGLVPHQQGLLTLSGRLEVGRLEEPDGRVSWLRLHLPPQALAPEQRPTTPSATPVHSH